MSDPLATGRQRVDLTSLSKGERTRLNILQATLRVIATSGHYSASHRAIAKEAGVSLSLTTYYFKDLQELLFEAFRLHKRQLHEELRPTLTLLQGLAEDVSVCRQQGEAKRRRQLILSAVKGLCDFVVTQIDERSQGVTVEMSFYFDIHLPEHIRLEAFELRQRFIDDIAFVCSSMGSIDAQTDAELIISSMQRLQYEALSVPIHTGPVQIRQQLERLLTALWL